MDQTRDPGETWHHPLIRKADSRVTRRRFMLGASSAAAVVALSGQLIQVAAQGTPAAVVATPEFAPSGDADATALLVSAGEAMNALKSFHFDLKTISGTSSVMGFDLNEIVGDVRRPLDFKAEVSVKVPFGSLKIQAVGIGGTFYIQDPLSSSHAWTTIDTGSDVAAALNPDVIILLAVQLLEKAKIEGTDKYEGEQATRISGEVDFQKVASSVSGAAGSGSDAIASQLAEGPVPLVIWVSPENLILAIEIDGPLLAQEGDDVTRLVSFSAFNEPVEISAPES